ncbi:MAG: hypothetical protein GX444_18060 [Myxococcales bacterium]|nr:hypothetical protein [Myxococcales bacterium]
MINLPQKHLRHFNIPGHSHALTFSCYRQLPLLTKDRTRHWLMDAVERACLKHDYRLLAYVIMPEHIHLLVAPNKDIYDIAKFLQSVKQPVAVKARNWLRQNDLRWLERLTIMSANGKKHFQFWQQSGGYDRNLLQEPMVQKIIDYIHGNPVRKNLASRTTDWKWSSARWYAADCEGSIFTILEK